MRDRFFRFGLKHYRLSIVLAVLIILGLCVFNYWLFGVLFDSSYLAWYVNTGPVFGLVTIVIAAVWKGLDKEPGLISKNPYEYLGSYAQLAGLAMYTLTPIIDPKSYATRPPYSDYIVGFFFALLLMITIIAWLIFVIPLQYFVFLICGALPRMAPGSSKRVVAWLEGPHRKHLKMEEQPLNGVIPEDGWVATLKDMPFKLTGAFSAAFLFLLGQILNF
jgi:hypothetical protein